MTGGCSVGGRFGLPQASIANKARTTHGFLFLVFLERVVGGGGGGLEEIVVLVVLSRYQVVLNNYSTTSRVVLAVLHHSTILSCQQL